MKIVVIAIRGLQASLLGAYGNHWVSTSAVDSLAARGVVFDYCYADAASPEGVRLSWRTGRRHLEGATDVEPSSDLLAQLRGADIPTMLVHDVSRPLPETFLAGWSATVEVDPVEEEDPLELALQGAAELLDALRDEKNALVWLDLPTLLPPWNVPDEIVAPLFDYELVEEDVETEEEDSSDGEDDADEEEYTPEPDEEEDLDLFDENEQPPEYIAAPSLGKIDRADDHLALSLRMSCGAAVNAVDAGLEQLLRILEELDPGHEVAVVLTGDVGLPLGEHGIIGGYEAGPHEELLHVPLIVRLPGNVQAGRRVSELCQSVDLAVTLADLFGVRLPDAQGISLVPHLNGAENPPTHPYTISAVTTTDGVVAALRTEEASFVLPLSAEGEEPVSGRLYLQPEDAWEVNDVHQHHLEWADHLASVLRDALVATQQPGLLVLPELLDEEELLGEHEGQQDE